MPEPESETERSVPRSRPIAFFLFVLAFVAFVPLMAFSVILLQRNNVAQQEVVETLTVATAEAIGQAVDRQIEGMITTLRVLASTPDLGVADFETLHNRGAVALQGTGAYVAMIGPDYKVWFNTRYPYGTALAPSTNTGAVRRALDTGSVIVSGVHYSEAARDWVVPVYMPVKMADGTTDVMAVTQNADNLASALVSRQFPEGWQVALVDSDNRVIAASSEAGVDTGQTLFIPAADKQAWRKWTRVVVEGRHYVSTTANSITTGWSVVAWAPDSAVERPFSTSLASLVAGGLVIILAAGTATFFLAREIRRSVRGLADDARRLGLGKPVERHPYPISEIAVVSEELVEAAAKRQSAEAEVRFLMREVAHRSKNQMTVIAAMAKQTARSAESVSEFVTSFERRIFGLARSTDLLLAHGVAGVDLEELITRQIEPFCPVSGARVEVRGPACRLNTQAAQILGMAAHELATNAVKYGAFAREDGRLAVTWTTDANHLRLVWRETVPLAAAPSSRRGFGTTVLENMVGSALGADVVRTLHPDGIEWRFEIARSVLHPSPPPRGAMPPV